MARLELTTPRTQNECATNCATSRRNFLKNFIDLKVLDYCIAFFRGTQEDFLNFKKESFLIFIIKKVY